MDQINHFRRIAVISFIFLFSSLISWGQTLAEQADSAYNAGEFDTAAALYQKVSDTEGTSAPLYYNLGNSLYRLGQPASAIVAYERALRLDPSNSAIRANLSFVNSRLIDKKGPSGSFLSQSFEEITGLFSANGWAWLALALFGITIGAVSLYLFGSSITIKKTGFFGGGFTAVLFAISLIFAFNARSMMEAKNIAIVTAKSTILSTTPRAPQNRNEEAMLLHEGARLTIIDSIASPTDSTKTVWYDVAFDNDHRAWINSSDVEII
ncbi:MAG: tetratricopeptide repeat protein [Paramuribaculum sp.]|nr:tetratricopeptide repeat protein [Paramuribaculum sp.]